MMTLRDVQIMVDQHLQEVARYFKPGAKLTLLVRNELDAGQDGDFLMTGDTLAGAIDGLTRRAIAAKEIAGDDRMASFQAAVGRWMVEVFGAEIAMDPLERTMRFLEEAMELAQSLGLTEEECGRVAAYVWGRPTGEPRQEVGGVLVTLAALCFRQEIDMSSAGLAELMRIDNPEMRKRIFDKQAFKRSQGLTSDGGFRK